MQFSSQDLTGMNEDGDLLKAFSKYLIGPNEHVIFDAFGPGCLYRQQMNIWTHWDYGLTLNPHAGDSRIRFYFDDNPRPSIDLSVDEYFGGMKAGFAPFTFMDSANAPDPVIPGDKRFAVSYYPLTFAKRLRVTVTPVDSIIKDGLAWYQFTYLLYPPSLNVRSWDPRKLDSSLVSSAARVFAVRGADPKPRAGNRSSPVSIKLPKGTAGTLFSVDGAGALASLKLKLAPFLIETFYDVRIRITWDGASEPAVDLPIGVFFGGGGKTLSVAPMIPRRKLANMFYGFDGSTREFYSFWPMPFWSSARIEIVNDSKEDIVVSGDVEQTPKDRLPYTKANSGYFHAAERLSSEEENGVFATALEAKGHGHVVGISFYSQDYSMDGDEFTYFDGNRTPQVHGDGTEDDHNQGWGGAAYQTPLWGSLIDGFTGAYRIYLNDSYVFSDEIKMRYEFSTWEDTKKAKTDIITYYYLAANDRRLIKVAPTALKLTDKLDIGNANDESLHDYRIDGQTWAGALTSSYDGYEKNVDLDSLTKDGRAFRGRSSFNINIDPENDGVRLRKLLSRSGNGVQIGSVWVDGVELAQPWGVIFNSSAPANQSWVDSEYELPARLTRGKSRLRIEIRHLKSTRNELNEFRYTVFSHVGGR